MSDIGGYFNVVCMHESIHPADVFGGGYEKGQRGGIKRGKEEVEQTERRGNRELK